MTAQLLKMVASQCKEIQKPLLNTILLLFLHKYTNNLQIPYEKKIPHDKSPNKQSRQPCITKQKLK